MSVRIAAREAIPGIARVVGHGCRRCVYGCGIFRFPPVQRRQNWAVDRFIYQTQLRQSTPCALMPPRPQNSLPQEENVLSSVTFTHKGSAFALRKRVEQLKRTVHAAQQYIHTLLRASHVSLNSHKRQSETLRNLPSYFLDDLTLSMSASDFTLATFSFLLETVSSLKMNLNIVSNNGFNFITFILPKLQAYFYCLDLQQVQSTSSYATLEKSKTGFDITGEQITFNYPHHAQLPDKLHVPPKPALQDLTFHFETGKMHALVGDNGCGKRPSFNLYVNFTLRTVVQ